MGNRESSRGFPISYEQAAKELEPEEFARLKEAWKRTGTETMDYVTFRRQVCSEMVPNNLTRALFDAFASGNRLKFEELVVGLVILTKGNVEDRRDLLNQVVLGNNKSSAWVYEPPRLTDESYQKTSSFYEILAGVTHLTETEVGELEKVWDKLVDSRVLKLTLEGFRPLVSPPVAPELVDGFFGAFDENGDLLIDFKELVCGLSASCRGPKTERLKFVFKILDVNGNGLLTQTQVQQACDIFTQGARGDWIKENGIHEMNLHDFLTWALDTCVADSFLQIIEEVGHICLGLKPVSFPDEQRLVRSWKARLKEMGLNQCSRWMLVSSQWWGKWDKAQTSDQVGAIDNSPLLIKDKHELHFKLPTYTNEGGFLRKELSPDDFEMVTDALWSALCRWHGGGEPALARYLISDPNTEQLMIELYPLTLVVLRHQPVSIPNYSTNGISGVASSTMEWVKETVLHSLTNTPPSSQRTAQFSVTFSKVARVGELFNYLCQSQRLNPETARLWLMVPNEKDKGTGMLLLEDDTLTLAELDISTGAKVLLEVRNSDLTWPEEVQQLRQKGYFKLDLRLQSAAAKGVTGLNNLGNTCFMNSALQCTSNTKPLTEYFNAESYMKELNRTNALGSKGQIALEYGNLVKDLWSGNSRVVAPLRLRSTVNRYCGTFKDLYQHDCQEFLAFLLDGLHEDLNRVQEQQKYDELKDSDGRPDDQVAQEAWDHHMKRNRSVVTDLFHGQLKSEVTCAECGSKSARFDPFTFLSLPLPLEEYTLLQVVVVRLDGSIPVRYGFRLKSEDRVPDLLAHVSLKCHIPSERMLLLELSKLGQFYRDCKDCERVKTLGRETLLYAYELPAPTDPVPNGIIPKHKEPNVHGQYVIATHRRVERDDVYFLAHTRARHLGFGLPLVVPFNTNTTGDEIYKTVWTLLQRLMHPPAKREPGAAAANRALDAEEDSDYPFSLCCVAGCTGLQQQSCAKCAWHRLCPGCAIKLDETPLDKKTDQCCMAIDWDSTALHLRYEHSSELLCDDDPSVGSTFSEHYKPTSIDSCLQEFTSVEELNDDEAVYCKHCKKNRPASKKLDIWRLPQILIVHLKRFVFTGNRWNKSTKVVEFPVNDFDPRQYMVSDLDQCGLYDCFAIANHYGDMGAGHYVAYGKNANGKWYLYNDSRCKEVLESEIDRNNSYLLFYERREQTKL